MRHTRTTDRGQTGLDFVVGIGLFLLAMAFLVGFAPNMVASHTDSPELPLVADRATAHLTEQTLGDGGRPAVLDTACADAFFAATGTCGGVDMARPLPELVGIAAPGDSTSYDVYVALQVDGTTKTRGEKPPATATSTSLSRRLVVYDGKNAYLTVTVWR